MHLNLKLSVKHFKIRIDVNSSSAFNRKYEIFWVNKFTSLRTYLSAKQPQQNIQLATTEWRFIQLHGAFQTIFISFHFTNETCIQHWNIREHFIQKHPKSPKLKTKCWNYVPMFQNSFSFYDPPRSSRKTHRFQIDPFKFSEKSRNFNNTQSRIK